MVFSKLFDDIDHTDVENLLNNKVAERQNLEYKQQIWEHNDAGTREMLRDISSMANTFGGYVILGVTADQDGLPLKITDVVDAEKEAARILSSCISSIEPRIPGFRIKAMSYPEHKSLVIIFIPRSARSPHMITFKGLNQFWIRHGRQKSPMSIEEIREACLRVENLQTNVQEFITARKSRLLGTVNKRTTLVIGTLPLVARCAIIDMKDGALRQFLANPPEQRRHGYNLEFRNVYDPTLLPTPTLHGLKVGDPEWKKVELMRNGYYEFLVILEGEGHRKQIFKKELYVLDHLPIIEYTASYFRALKMLAQLSGVEETLISFLTIFNIENYGFVECLRDLGLPEHNETRKYEEPHLDIEPMEIYDLEHPDRIAKTFLDRIWNAFGFEAKQIPYFKNGRFVPPGSLH